MINSKYGSITAFREITDLVLIRLKEMGDK